MAPQESFIEDTALDGALTAPGAVGERRAGFGDPLFSLGFGLWTLTVIVALAPFVPPSVRSTFSDLWADFVILPYVLLLCLLNARRGTSRAEEKFWWLFVAALTTWLAVRIMYVAWPDESWGITEDVTTDILYGFFYLMLALALEMKPHERPLQSPVLGRSTDHVPILTTVIFFAATVTYFIVLPARQDAESYRYWLSSFGLYVAFDLYLLGRVLALSHHLDDSWGRVYRWLAAVFVMWALTDATEGLLYADMLPWIEPGSMYEIAWYIPGLAFIVAVRTRWWSPVQRGAPPETR